MGTGAIDSPESETNVLDAGAWEVSESGWQHRTAAFCACETVDRAINYDGRRRTRLIESAEGDGEGYESPAPPPYANMRTDVRRVSTAGWLGEMERVVREASGDVYRIIKGAAPHSPFRLSVARSGRLT